MDKIQNASYMRSNLKAIKTSQNAIALKYQSRRANLNIFLKGVCKKEKGYSGKVAQLCEIKTAINSRPLMRMSDEPNDLDIIKPQNLLFLPMS